MIDGEMVEHFFAYARWPKETSARPGIKNAITYAEHGYEPLSIATFLPICNIVTKCILVKERGFKLAITLPERFIGDVIPESGNI